VGDQNGTRNAPTLYNIAYAPALFWDGGVPTLEEQVVGPIQNPLEMAMNINAVVTRLLKHPDYVALFEQAYNQPPDVYALSRAIASYERTLYSGNSRYDRYLQDEDSSALNPSEIRGKNIFFGEKGECFHCHGEYNFTNYSYQNNGLYAVYADSGRERITLNPDDYGKFKVPSLRNIAATAPYMHDGSLTTLEEVVDHYNSGGHPDATTSFFIKPLGFTDQDKADLVNFLKALTDSTVVVQ
jgi:cytochrome c peroxidase